MRPSSCLAALAIGVFGCGSTVSDTTGDGGGGTNVVPPVGGAGLGNQGGAGAFDPSGGATTGGQGGVPSTGGAGGENQGGEGGGDPGVFDCATAPSTAVSSQAIPGARGYHGLAINDQGLMFGIDQNNNLIRSTYDGAWTPFINNVQGEQIAFAPNGDLHIASFSAILTATPSAQLLTLNGSQQSSYGLRMGPDGKVWVADSSAVKRIDPDTSTMETVVTNVGGGSFHSFDFNRAGDRLYIGVVGGGNHVSKVDLDLNYNAIGGAQAFAQIPGGGSVWLDGIATDVCGNLYVANYTTNNMYRITPAGAVSLYFDWSSSQYGHGVIFGNGKFGFRQDAVYVPQPYNGHTVMEIVVGIPGRDWPGTVLNGP